MKKIKIITWNLGHALFNKEYFQNVSQNKISFKNIFPNKRKIVIANATNQIELIKKIDADIVLLQETSKLYLSNYFINQIKLIKKHLPYYNLYYTSHTKWPLINSGNAIMSKIVGKFDKNFFPFRTKGHLRNKLYSNKSIPVLRIPIDNKELVVFCIHLIPFNEHNNIRNQEIEYLLKLATKETRKGNYVIIGGDFNTDLSNLSFKEFCVNSDSKGTIRSLRKAYTKSSKNKNYDGFITSSNIKVLKVSSFDNYEYSDHSPVIIEIII